MPNFNKLPKITWGASFANTVNFAYPVDNWSSYSQPREGSMVTQAQSGVEDSWRIGTDYYLSVELKWMPNTDTTTPLATGWDGATGVRAFVEYAQDKNVCRWYPDKTSGTYIHSYLVEPMTGGPTTEIDGTKTLRIVMRNSGSAYDGY